MALKDAFTRVRVQPSQVDRDRDTLLQVVGQVAPATVGDWMRTVLSLVDRQGTTALFDGLSSEQVQAIGSVYTLLRTAMVAWDADNAAVPEFAALRADPAPPPEPEPIEESQEP